MTRLGALVGVGRTSEVFAFGARRVVKLLRPGVPLEWAETEAVYSTAARDTGVPVPAVHGVVNIDDRAGIVFEHIDGPSMWSRMLEAPDIAVGLARELADIHRQIQAARAPAELPELTERVERKIAVVDALTETERTEAREIASGLDPGKHLYHGDFHPGNVMMSATGPLVIDWFDAAAGSALADVVRTSLLLRPPIDGSTPLHLPGATTELLRSIHREYLRAAMAGRDVSAEEVRSWEAVQAAGRLAEDAERSELELVELWRRRQERTGSPMLDELSALGIAVDDAQL